MIKIIEPLKLVKNCIAIILQHMIFLISRHENRNMKRAWQQLMP